MDYANFNFFGSGLSGLGLWALMFKTETRRTGEGSEFPIKMYLRKRGE
jgi:hypothetical protein